MHNDVFKKLTTEIKNALFEKLATSEFKEFIAKTKAASDSGTFEVVISTADKDRQGEIVDQAGWVLDNYKNNPVVLFGHDYYSLPIGVTDSIEVVNGNLVAKGRFAPADANPFAQQVRKMYDAGMLKTTSVGFIPLEFDNENTILKAELLEFSFVPVPANPYALSLRQIKELGLDLNMLAQKSFEFVVKGDPVENKKTDAGDEPNDNNEAIHDLLKAEHDTHVKNIDEYTKTMCSAIMGDGEKTASAYSAKDIEDFKAICTKAIEEFKSAVSKEHDRHAAAVTKAVEEAMPEGDDSNDTEDPKEAKSQKVGRAISSENRKKLADIQEHLKAAIGSVEDLAADESGDDDSNGDEGGDGKAQKTGSKNPAASIDDKALKTFLDGREALREVATVISESLEKYNKTSREIRK